tara:strand:- start:126500 stop:127174 length:675 start_codon:yes stop_codon:yes gene_type:complete
VNSPHLLVASKQIDFRSPVFVIGAGGHGKVVAQILREMGADVAGMMDDDPSAETPEDTAFLGPITQLNNYKNPQAVIAIGCNLIRRRVRDSFQARWLTAIHPSAYVSPSAKLGRGVVVCANAAIGEDAVIGEHVIVNTSTSVDHDAKIGEFTHLACGVTLAGGVEIGDDVLVGAGATVLPFIRIGNRATLGAGGVATRNIDDEVIAYGVPARPLKRNDDGILDQ